MTIGTCVMWGVIGLFGLAMLVLALFGVMALRACLRGGSITW